MDQDGNELITLEVIRRLVELLDDNFKSVCELNPIWNFERTYFILDEFIRAGEVQETRKKLVLKAIVAQDVIPQQETTQGTFDNYDLG